MPTGLPDLSNFAESVRLTIADASGHVRDAADYFHIPSYAEYSSSVQDAYLDLARASKSSWHLFHLTFRPVYILLALIAHYVAIVLKLLAECTFKHGIVAAREGANQARIAATWFIAWQRSLSRGAVFAELGMLASVVGVYLLRRHIRRKRYVEKVRSWSARKKARALRKYRTFVGKVSKTSMFLAMLMPHALYISLVSALKYFAPWLIRYLATKTYLVKLLSLWIPFTRTVMLLHRWTGVVKKEKEMSVSQEIDETKNDRDTSIAVNSNRRVKFRGKTSSSVAERYLKATEQSSTATERTPVARLEDKGAWHPESADGSSVQLYEEAIELLKYWVVFALVSSIFRMASLLPVVGRIISVENPPKTVVNGIRRWPGLRETKSVWSSLELSYYFVEEMKLVFFTWLRYLPTSLTATSLESVHGKAATWEKKLTGGIEQEVSSNHPLDILYQRLAPMAVTAADSSSNLSQATDSDTGIKGLLHQGMNVIKSFLQVAVFMKVISDETKTWIETSLVECSALLPAVVTLLMPGYFTEFGCIYVSKIVPSANSAASFDVLKTKYTENFGALLTADLTLVMRFLKYWVVHSLFTAFLSAFAPLLVWVPLSTHVTWLFWAYIQLESPTNRIYAVFEWELKAFGLLHRHPGDKREDMEFGKTVTAGLIRSLSSVLPSASSLDGAKEKENGAKEQKQIDPVLAESNSGSVKEVHLSALDTKDKVPHSPSVEAIGGSVDRGNDPVGPRRRTVLPKLCDAEGRADNGTITEADPTVNISLQRVDDPANIVGSSEDDKSKME